MENNDFEKSMTNIGNELGKMLSEYGARVVLRQGTVTAVYLDDEEDEEKQYTMDVRMANGAEVMGIVLSIVGGGNTGVLIIPQVDSKVVLAMLDGNAAVLLPIYYSRIAQTIVRYDFEEETDKIIADSAGISIIRDKYTCNITSENISLLCEDGASIELTDDTITMNGGELKGLVKLEQLEKNLESLKSYCEALKSATSAGFGAIKGQITSNGASEFSGGMAGKSISFEDMENDKIIQ